jgi:undecaprenyl-diphosphatase
METWKAIAVGAIQGLAEFLPISSSGHLKLYQIIYEIEGGAPLALEVILHIATLIAVVAIYWRTLFDMIRSPIKSDFKWLVLATIPAVIFALAFKDAINAAANSNYLGYFFLITCALLLIAEALSNFQENRHGYVTWFDALIMGVMQAVGVLPGISRSGAAISGGLASGLKRKEAADFAFLMSVPAVLGAGVMLIKDIYDLAKLNAISVSAQFSSEIAVLGGWKPVTVGFFTALICGLASIKIMLFVMKRASLRWFAMYTGFLGGIVILWNFFGQG